MTSLGKKFRHLFVLPACAGLVLAMAHGSSAQTTPPSGPGPSISGFRNAQFGMTQGQVKSAIESAFKLAPGAITAGVNAVQHTNVLSVSVPNLIPDGGTATVSYVFGYQSHKLFEINVLWATELDPKTTPTTLTMTGESLQQYFAGEGFPPQRSTGNVAIQTGFLLFRATDPTGNAVLLILSGATSKDPKAPDKSILTPNALTLTYAANPEHPDVFQLAKGSF